MSAYYFGESADLTAEQIKQRDRKFKLYEEYGIPCGIFDGTPEVNLHSIQKRFRQKESKNTNHARQRNTRRLKRKTSTTQKRG